MNPKSLIIIIILITKKVFFIIKAGLCTQGDKLSIAREDSTRNSRVERAHPTSCRCPVPARGGRLPHGEGNREEERELCVARNTRTHVLYQAGTAECQRVSSQTVCSQRVCSKTAGEVKLQTGFGLENGIGERQSDNQNLLGLKNASGYPRNASKLGHPAQPLALVVRTQPACSGLLQLAFYRPLAKLYQLAFGDFGYASC